VLAGLAVGGVVLAGTTAADPPEASSLGKIKCHQTTGTANVDPIVHHNKPVGSAHLHQFFGNNAFLSLPNPNTANYLDLMGRGTNCENAADTAGYWAPTLHNTKTGAVVPVASFTAYYRSWNGRTTGAGLPHPSDTRLVAADYDWTCGQKERVEPSASIPDCSKASGGPGSRLTAHINFPTCWDGVLPVHKAADAGNTSDNAHYAYRLSRDACPAGFPVKVVELRMTISWAYTGSGTDVALSSDSHMGTTDGRSMHADFWNTWVQAGYTTMVRDCINPGRKRSSARCG
jgi:hypothetical protein